MKKLLAFGVGVLSVAALAACGGGGSAYDKTVLSDPDHAAYCAAGPDVITVDGREGGLAWDYSEAGKMLATSLDGVSKISTQLADTLKEKGVKYLYMLQHINLGANSAGWTTLGYKQIKGEKVLVKADGSLCIKATNYTILEETGAYLVDQWLPSPETHGESLTPDYLWFPPYTETKDEYGIDWNSNPIAVQGAGSYTLITAIYKKSTADGAIFGNALIPEKLNAEGAQPEAVVPEVVNKLTVMGLGDWNNGVVMTEKDGSWSATVEATDTNALSMKVRANDAWDYAWGYGDLTMTPDELKELGLEEGDDGNIKLPGIGSYVVTIKVPNPLSVVKKNADLFTIEKAEVAE